MSARIASASIDTPRAAATAPPTALTPHMAALQQLLQPLLKSACRACFGRLAEGPEGGTTAGAPPRGTGQATQANAEGAGGLMEALRDGIQRGVQAAAEAQTALVGVALAGAGGPASSGTTQPGATGATGTGSQGQAGAAGSAVGGAADPWSLPATTPVAGPPLPPQGLSSTERPSDHEVIAILGRHEARFKDAKPEALRKMADDPSTPPDLKRGLEELLRNDGLQKMMMHDGDLHSNNINHAQKNMPGQKEYAEGKSREYTRNYVPSDTSDPQATPRPMTSNDAMRELFKYSDELPKHVSRDKLKEIADGTARADKCPPQLQAAAQFYVDNPDAWKRDFNCDPNKSIRKDGLLNNSDDKIQLTQKEHDTLQTLSNNRDLFFGGKSLTPDKLKKIAGDESVDAKVREAAQELHDNKMLFAMLDNGKHQHGGNIAHPANDKKIGRRDLDAWLGKMNKTVAPDRTGEATSRDHFSIAATRDMLEGKYSQPDFKDKKGGGLASFGAGLLKGFSFVAGIASDALSAIAALRIPGISWLAGAGAVGMSMAEGGAKVGATAIDGGDVKKEGIAAGIGAASTVVGLLGGRGASQAAKEALDTAADQGRKAAQRLSASAAVGQADNAGSKAASVGAQTAAKSAAKGVAGQAASYAANEVLLSARGSGAPAGGVQAQQQVDVQLQGIASQYGRA